MNEFPMVLFCGVLFLLGMSRLGWSSKLPLIITAAPFLASLYMILSRDFNAQEAKWAFATAGTILGYWLKPDD